MVNTHNIHQELLGRAKKYRKIEIKRILTVISFSMSLLILFFFIFKSLLYSIPILLLILLFSWIYLKQTRALNDVEIFNKDRLAYHLIIASSHMNEYLKNTTLKTEELSKSRKSLSLAISTAKNSASNMDQFKWSGSINVPLKNLGEYLIYIKNNLDNLNKENILCHLNKLEVISEHIYSDNFSKVNSCIKREERCKSLKTRSIERFFDYGFISLIISIFLIISTLVAVAFQYDIINDPSGMSLFLEIILIFLGISAFQKIRKTVSKIIEFLSNLLVGASKIESVNL